MTTEPVPTPEQQPVQVQSPISAPKRRYRLPWIGLVLILVGGYFFLRQAGQLPANFNWWALFILIPALGSLTAMFGAIERGGFNQAARSSLGSAVVIFTVAFIFLFDLSWTIYWPLLVIAVGFSSLIGSIPGKALQDRQNVRHLMGLGVWIGAAGMLLGVAFLLKNLGIYDFNQVLGDRWYAWLILIPGIGTLVNAFLLYRAEGNKINIAVRVMIGFGIIIITLAVLMIVGIAWSILGPLMIIGAGLAFIISAFLK